MSDQLGIEDLIVDFMDKSDVGGDLSTLTRVISIGIVVDNDDPLEQGRLRIFCPSYNGGHIPGKESTNGAVHYGFWAIPEIGAHALVACINGDPRRRVWLGCLPSHQETHTQGHGRFKHEDGQVRGPLSSEGEHIQPTVDKLEEAFDSRLDSSEWKTRAAEYQIASIKEAPNPNKAVYIDSNNEDMQNEEQDSWVVPLLGDHGYDWTGFKNLASFLASRVFSWSTPGFHSIQMDDRAFNSRVRIRTTGGSQIILDDTNERMYFSVSGGKSWLEMDASGNVDVYAKRRFSIHAEKDLNFSAGESIRLKAGKFISMYSGTSSSQTPLPENVGDGEIRIHSSADTHLYIGGALQSRANGGIVASFAGGDLTFNGALNVRADSTLNMVALNEINMSAQDVTFTIVGKGTTIDTLTEFLDHYVDTFNTHTHVNAGGNLSFEDPIELPDPVAITVSGDGTRFAPWTNRLPQHEPWPRNLMQDNGDAVNTPNTGYLDNVGWVPQYTNTGQEGREFIGKIEGTDIIERGPFWRR
jgi:uncharacterized protein (DUF2345 family)